MTELTQQAVKIARTNGILESAADDRKVLSVNSDLARFDWCSEGRQCGLHTQHRNQPLDVGFGPGMLVAASPYWSDAAIDLMTAMSPYRT